MRRLRLALAIALAGTLAGCVSPDDGPPSAPSRVGGAEVYERGDPHPFQRDAEAPPR